MKIRRSDRLIDMTYYLIGHPHKLISLPFFAQRYESAKSSISEDMAIIRRTFLRNGLGIVETLPGAAGGVRYLPGIGYDTAKKFLTKLTEQMADPERLLPGNYVYLSDLLGNATTLHMVGRLIAGQYAKNKVTKVMTIATKGISIAQSTAAYLGVPFVVVRRDSKVTEGATVSVNYVSASSSRVEKMELSKRSLQTGDRVLVVDDFMKGGGTLRGMHTLLREFGADLVGISVLAEVDYDGPRLIDDYTSLLNVSSINTEQKQLQVQLGNYLQRADLDLFKE